jgi:putative transposase
MTTQTYRRARHSASVRHAHLVFVTNDRRPVFTDQMLTFAENTMRTACCDLDVELVEFNGETDHVHLLVAYPPTMAISTLVQRLKRSHRQRGATRIHRPLRPCPPTRPPLIAVVRRRSPRRTTVYHQEINRHTSTPHSTGGQHPPPHGLG